MTSPGPRLALEHERARAEVALEHERARSEERVSTLAVQQLVAPLQEQLGRVDAQLLRLDQERRESRGRLEAQLRTLTEANEKLRSETGALVTALRKPNARAGGGRCSCGTWSSWRA